MGRRRLNPAGGYGAYTDLNALDPSDFQVIIDAFFNNSRFTNSTSVTQSRWFQTLTAAHPSWTNYDTFKFILIALEDIPLLEGGGTGWTADDGARPYPGYAGNYALGFGYDPHKNRATLLGDLQAAGIVIPQNLLASFQNASGYDQTQMNNLMAQLTSGGFRISYDQAVSLFGRVEGDIETNVSNLFRNLGQSIERAVAFDLRYNGYFMTSGNGPHERLYDRFDAGDFMGAAVQLGLTDDRPSNNISARSRDVSRARVLFLSQILGDEQIIGTDPEVLWNYFNSVMSTLSTGSPTISFSDKALQGIFNFADGLRSQSGNISILAQSTDLGQQDRAAFFNDAMNISRGVLARQGYYLTNGSSMSVASAANSTGADATALATIYGSAGFSPYSIFFVPQGAAVEVNADADLSSLQSAQNGQRRVVKFDHDSQNFVSFLVRDAVEGGVVSFVSEQDRTLLVVEDPDFIAGFERNGSGYTVTMVDGDIIKVTPDTNTSGDYVILEYTPQGDVSKRYTERRGPDSPVVVASGGTLRRNANFYGGEWAANDFENVVGLQNASLLAQLLGRPDAPVGMGGSEGPLLSLEDIIDPDGPVSYQTEIDGSVGQTVAVFHLDNGGAGFGDRITQVVRFNIGQDDHVITYAAITRDGRDARVTRTFSDPNALPGTIGLVEPEIDIQFGGPNSGKLITIEQVGSIFGSSIGRYLAGGNIAGQIVLGSVISTLSGNLGELADNLLNDVYDVDGVTELSSSAKIDEALGDIGADFLRQLKSATAGALSSYLLAELFDAVGIGGVPAELGQTVAGAYLSATIEALPELLSGATKFSEVFQGIDPLSIVASWAGSTLASELVDFDTIGGQLGSSIGAAAGAIVGAKIGATLGGPVGAVIGAFIGAFIGNIGGGFIGSIFGGTPRSGADAAWNPETQRFEAANVYSRKGGNEESARSVSAGVSEIYNAVLTATESLVLNPAAVQTGNYGMRKSDWVYRPYSTREKSAITATFDNPEDLILHGTAIGLKDLIGQLAGGDVFVKRAIFNVLDSSDGNADGVLSAGVGEFNVEQLTAAIATAKDFGFLQENQREIAVAIAADPRSNFALGWATTIALAHDLGLGKRQVTDWVGGYGVWLDELDDGKFDDQSFPASLLEMRFNFDGAGREWLAFGPDGSLRDVLTDDISFSDQTKVLTGESDTSSQMIDLRSGSLADQTGYIVNGVTRNDIAQSGVDFTADTDVARTIAANALRGTASVTAASDALSEEHEDFRVELGDGTGTYLQRREANVTIVDAADVAYLMVGRSYASEADGHLVWRVSLSKAAAGSVALELALAAERAEAGVDFTDQIQVSANGASGWSNATSLTLGTGVTEYFVRIAITDDNTTNPNEANERIVLSATVATGASYLENGDQTISGIGTIIDGSNTDPLVWADDLIIHEGTTADVSVARSRAATTSSSFTYSTADNRVLEIPVAATVDAGGGNDTVHASDLGDNVFGGDGDDILYGGKLDDWLLGGDGDDDLYAGAQGGSVGGNGNYLNGGDGNDELFGYEGSDWLEGGAGVDIIKGGAGDDILSGGAGIGDQLYGGIGDDTYILRLGDEADIADDVEPASTVDRLAAPVEATSWRQALSGEWLIDASFDAYVDAASIGAGGYIQSRYAGIASGSVQRDWLGYFTPGVTDSGLGGGEDSLTLGYGIDVGDIQLVKSANGNDLIVKVMDDAGVATGDQMTLVDWFVDPFKRIEWLKFADGNEIRIGDITSFIVGTHGNDTLVGTAGNDFLYGGPGNDRLFLLAGDDIGSGGSGMDYVAGDSGDDLIVGGSGSDALTGGAGLDILTGDGGDDDLYGGDGNDIISGGHGDDHLVGGAGDDVFKYSRGDGADVIFDEFTDAGAAGWETVWTQAGGFAAGYTLHTGAGTHPAGTITDSNGDIVRQVVETEDGVQLQWVGRWEYDSQGTSNSGVPVLRRYVEPTSGSAVKDADGTASWRWDSQTGQYVSGTSLGDLIEFAPGINIQDIVLRQNGNDLIMYITRDGGSSGIVGQGGDSITLKDWFHSSGDGLNNIERLAFFATGELDLTETDLMVGTEGDDTLSGGSGADWATGGTGDDNIYGGAGDDILAGNGGNDIIRGEAGDDVLYGGSGDDVLIGGGNSTGSGDQGDVLIGGAGSDWASYENETTGLTASLINPSENTGAAKNDNYASIENLRGGSGADQLIGDDGDNILEGGAGNDALSGRDGDDTYVFGASGSGQDTINEGLETTTFAALPGGTLGSGFVADWYAIEESVWNPPDPEPQYTRWQYQIRDGDQNVVFGHNDTILQYEWASKPTASRSLTTWGWSGGYTYDSTDGSASKTVVDSQSDAGIDTIELDEGLTLSSLAFAWSGNDLIITTTNGDSITIKNQTEDGGKVEFLQFHDGLAVSLDNLFKETSSTGSDDAFIFGGATGETLAGGVGNDVIFGGGGNDTLQGGDGDDDIEGGAGADTLEGGSNSANDGTNPLWGDTLSYRSSTTGVVNVDFTDQGTQNTQSGGDAAGDIISGFENFAGSLTNRDEFFGDDSDNRAFGFGGNDELRGRGGDDVLVGDDGDDDLYGDAGEDNLSGGAGEDYLEGGTGNDFLDGGEGSDLLYGNADDDVLVGGDGDDGGTGFGLYGGSGSDQLDGGAGNDDLFGEVGDDTLIGGLGDDTLEGGLGDDTYYFASGDGDDVITDTSGINVIVFGFGANANGSAAFDTAIAPEDLWLTKSGDDLIVSVIGGDASVTVTDYFAASNPSLIDKIQTASGTLFLNDPEVSDGDGLNPVVSLVEAMTAHSSTTPATFPDELRSQVERLWSATETPAPRAPVDPIVHEIETLTPNAFNLDQWPVVPPTGKSTTNLVDADTWPADPAGAPTGDAQVTGWPTTSHTAESTWDTTTAGPYDKSIVTMRSTQDGTSGFAGGSQTNEFTIDGSKTYEFTYYFRREAGSDQRVMLGTEFTGASAASVERAQSAPSSGAETNPYFFSEFSQASNELLPADTWYKVVAYVFAEGSAAVPSGDMGGVYDTTTGQKVADVTNFRWSASRVDDVVHSRFYGYGGTPTGGDINFYTPQVREVLDPAYNLLDGDELNTQLDSLFIRDAATEGFQNSFTYTLGGETRWNYVTGADGNPTVVLEAGQFDNGSVGGGNITNELEIDTTKTYRYVQFFRKNDLSKHRTFIAAEAFGSNGDGKLRNTDGSVRDSSAFIYLNETDQETYLVEDEWYMLVGYVRPASATNDTQADYGGVYRVSDGAKVTGIDVDQFRWAAPDNGNTITARGKFYVVHDYLDHGWSTQFDVPSFAAIAESDLAAYEADPFLDVGQMYGEVVQIDASIDVTDADNNITEWAINPDDLPQQGEIVSINASTGVVDYRPFANAVGEDSFSVVVLDSGGNQTVVPVRLNLTLGNVNQPPELPDGGYALEIAENSAVETLAGTLTATDPEGENTKVDYMFSGALMTQVGGKYVTYSNDSHFRIERDTGKAIFNEGTLDYESGQQFGYQVRVTDLNSGFNSRPSYTSLNIAVTDVNEPHSIVNASVDVNHYNKALGPFVPMPDENGYAINLYDRMITDTERSALEWTITGVTDGNSNPVTGLWSLSANGTLHLDGAITAGQVYLITVEAEDLENQTTVSAVLTVNVGQLDGFEYTPVVTDDYNFDFDWWRSFDPNYYLPPIVLDLDGDGVELVSFVNSTARFDMDGDGNRDRTGWFGADDGLLVYDQNNNGLIDDGSEISFQQFVQGAFSDLEGLAFFDTNSDGVVDANDDQFADLQVWRDLDQDGISDSGELFTLTALGIESISLSATLTGNSPNSNDNVIWADGSYRTNDGQDHALADTFLVFDPLSYLTDGVLDEPDEDDGTGDNGGTSNTGSEDTGSDVPAIEFGHLNFDRKTKKYFFRTSGGDLFIQPRSGSDGMDARAGLSTGATMFSFRSWSYGMLSAVILDLDNDGIETRRYKKTRAAFDMDANGSRDNVGWTNGDDGFLVIDRNGNDRIDDASEMAFLNADGDLQFGRAGLLALDSNGDGVVSADDDLFGELRIWVDRDEDGITDEGEMRLLSEHGIESISLGFAAVEESKKVGRNLTLSSTVFTRTDGTTGTAGDIALGFVPEAAPAMPSVSTTSRLWREESFWNRLAGYNLDEMSIERIYELWSRFDSQDERFMAIPGMIERRRELAQQASAEGAGSNVPVDNAAIAPGAANSEDSSMALRLALLRQDMAAFGAGSGFDNQRMLREGREQVLDYFA